MQKRLPKGWRMARLGEVVSVDKGKKMTLLDSYCQNSQPYIGIDNLRTNEYTNFTSSKNGLSCVNSDLLIAWDGANAGTVGYGLAGFVGSTIARLHPNEKIRTEFLGYFLKTKFAYFNASTHGAAIPHLSKTRLLNTVIPLPPLSTQKKIVGILEEADSLRKLRKQADEKMRDLIPSLFVQMFGDPATNPKGWRVVKIKHICEVVSGFGFPLELQGEIACEVPFYKVSDMNLAGNEQYMLTHNNSLSIKKIAELKYQIFPSDTIIFPKIGAAIATNKKRLLSKPSIFDNNVMGLIPSDKINHLYLYYLVQGINISVWASESQPPSIRKSTVERFEIPLPPLPLQQEFAACVEEIEAEKTRQADSKTKLDELFNSLMQKAFIGELVA